MNRTVTQDWATIAAHDQFIAALKEGLINSGMTIKELSRRTGWSREAIYSYINDKRSPRLDVVVVLLRELGYKEINFTFRR